MATSALMSTGAQAAEYVRQGFALCSIPRGRKGTNKLGWNRRENAITDAAQAARLAENVGLLHAYSGTMVLDIDDAREAKDWLRERGLDLTQLFAAPDAVLISSGREGRGKILYRLPPGTVPIRTVQVKGRGRGVILEFRCADAGGNSVQDVLPPSIHPDTKQPYRWAGPGRWSAPPEIPDALLAVWQDEVAQKFPVKSPQGPQLQAQSPNQRTDLLADTPENRVELARLMGAVVAGKPVFDPNAGHDEWLRDLWSIAALGEWCKEAAQQWSKQGSEYDARKFEQDWANFDPARSGGITERSFFAKLREAGIQHNLVQAAAPSTGVLSMTRAGVPGASLMSLPHLLPVNSAVTETNRFIGFTHDWGGKPGLFREDVEGRAYPCAREEMRGLLANRFVNTDAGRKPLFTHWEASPDRRTVAQVVYDPKGGTTNASGEPILNLWRGLARSPGNGSWNLMAAHLYQVVCGGNQMHFQYLLAWMAHLVQKPWEAPGVVVVLRSPREGTGKTTVLGWLAAIMGIHGLMLSDPTQLLGRFNTHLETLSFVGLNELGWAGDREAAAKLKSIITDPTITIERKHGNVYSVPNVLHVMATSNSDWVVPAGDGARRFFVLDVDPSRAGDHDYFASLHSEAETGGIEAMLQFLLRFQLDAVNLRAVPITEALVEQQERSLPFVVRWALDLADRGAGGDAGLIKFGSLVQTRALFADYQNFATASRVRALDLGPFGKTLTRWGLSEVRTSQARMRSLPSAGEFASLVRKSAGVHG